MNIITTSDYKYLPQFNALAASALKNSPKTHIVCRVINCAKDSLIHFSNVSYIFDDIVLESKPNIMGSKSLYFRKQKDLPSDRTPKYNKIPVRINNYQTTGRIYSELQSYCTGIKYDTLFTEMSKKNGIFVYSDVDALICKDLYDLENALESNNVDIGIVTDRQHSESVEEFNSVFKLYNEEVNLKTGGLLAFKKTETSLRFLEYCKNNIDLKNIDGDEIVFNEACTILNPKLLSIPVTFKDEGGREADNFSSLSYIWSGHGEVKDFSSMYDKEVKKYLKVADSIL